MGPTETEPYILIQEGALGDNIFSRRSISIFDRSMNMQAHKWDFHGNITSLNDSKCDALLSDFDVDHRR